MQSTRPDPRQTPPVNLLPTQPLGIGDIIDRSFRLYRRHFKVFLYTAAIVTLPLALVTGYFTQSAMQGQMNALQSLLTEGAGSAQAFEDLVASSAATGGAFALQFLLSIASAVAYLLTFLALTALAIRTLRGDGPTLSLGWRSAQRAFWPALRMGILVFLAFIGVALIVMLVFLFISFLGAGIFGGLMSGLDSGGGEIGAVIGLLIGLCCLMPLIFLLFVGPFVYLGARWTIATPALIDGNLGARESLRTSWRLTKGAIWRVVGFLVLIYILSFILFAVPYYIVQGLSVVLLGGQNIWLSAVIALLFGTLLQILWLPMTAIFPVLLYFDLRLRASGGDIGSRLERLEATLGQPSGVAPYTYTPPAAPTSPTPPANLALPTEASPPAESNTQSSWDAPSSATSDPWLDPANPPPSRSESEPPNPGAE